MPMEIYRMFVCVIEECTAPISDKDSFWFISKMDAIKNVSS